MPSAPSNVALKHHVKLFCIRLFLLSCISIFVYLSYGKRHTIPLERAYKISVFRNQTVQSISKKFNTSDTMIHHRRYQWNVEEINPITRKHSINLSFKEIIMLLKSDDNEFYDTFIDLFHQFAKIYDSYFFECIGVNKMQFDSKIFEFVLISAPKLHDVHSTREAFSSYFDGENKNKPIVSFPNLGNDAMLVVPVPDMNNNSDDIYTHLAKFIEYGDPIKVHELWKTVASVVLNMLLDSERDLHQKLWISTSGLGVYWLHVRLDTIPKYYQYLPYKINN